MFETYIVSHLADLIDGGMDEGLDAIQGTGATGVTLIVTSSARTHLRCNAKCDPRVYRTRGGYFYLPDAQFYADTHVKPIVATWVRGRQTLEKAVAACRQRGLKLRLRISGLEIGRIAEKYADAAAKDAFGDAAVETLCPASADVRGLLRGTIREFVERFGPDAIELADLRYHSGALGHRGLAIGFDPGIGFLAILSLCFCESSRQAAAERDIDTEAAARWARITLDKVLSSGRPCNDTLSELLRDAEIPRRYVRCQQDTLDALLIGLIKGAGVDVHLVLPGDGDDGVCPSHVSIKAAAGVLLESDIEAPLDVEEGVAELRRRFGEGVQITLDMDAAGDLGEDGPELVAAVKSCAGQGVSAVSFSEWGLMPAGRMKALKQGIRFAARSSS
jgi:hypothetical protein